MSIVTPTVAPSPFAEAWDRATLIDGWLSRNEAALLHRYAEQVPRDGFIAEVGAFHGKSATILASTGREMVTIDPLAPGTEVSPTKTITDDDAAELLNVVREFGNLEWVRLGASQVDPSIFPAIDMLYIDGDHKSDAAYRDFMHFKGQLKPGAVVAFHDFDRDVGVTQSVRLLERDGFVEFTELVESMYVGRYVETKTTTERPLRVFLAVPHCNDVETEAYASAKNCIMGHSGFHVFTKYKSFSILPSNFNKLTIECLNADHYDFLVIHHSDIECLPGWLGKMVRLMDDKSADVMHAVVPLKGDTGETSTAVAYNDDRWTSPRKLTQFEVHQLPDTFDVTDCQSVIDPRIERLLCNTGILCIRVTDKFKDFPGFSNLDRIVRFADKSWKEQTVPEDWNFGHWCADNGINVWGTRAVVTGHWGRWKFSSDRIWGYKTDPVWAAANGGDK